MSQAKTLTPQELRRVLDYVATRKHAARNRAMLLMTHLSGMRVGEVAALRINDVLDGDGNVRNEIRLDADQTKGNHARVVFVNEKLRKELTKYLSLYAPVNQEQKLFYTQKRMKEGFNANTLTQHFHHLVPRRGHRRCQQPQRSSVIHHEPCQQRRWRARAHVVGRAPEHCDHTGLHRRQRQPEAGSGRVGLSLRTRQSTVFQSTMPAPIRKSI